MTLSAKRPDGGRSLEPFVDPEQRTATALERAKREDPGTVKTLDEAQSLREVYQLAFNGVRKRILDEVPTATPESEPAFVMALYATGAGVIAGGSGEAPTVDGARL